MGYSNWSDAAYRTVSKSRLTVGANEIFKGQDKVDPLMDPRKITVRESRDSEHHPRSVPIIVAFDVTASMGHIPTAFAKEHLGTLMSKLVEQRWVTDPQVLIAAVGDAVSDRGPLQVGQFESGLEMDMWLTRLWLESRGGDPPESYTLAHWFARYRTSTDAWEKRKKKGYLFTIGDAANKELKPSHLARVFGGTPQEPCDNATLMAATNERWESWHVLVYKGATVSPNYLNDWRRLVANRVLPLKEISAICELMGVVMGVTEGTLTLEEGRAVLVEAGMAEDNIDTATRALF